MPVNVREQKKRDRKQRIFEVAMEYFRLRGFQETTILDIATTARVSRGTVFNYYPYKEAILIEYFARFLQDLGVRVAVRAARRDPVENLYYLFGELASFVEENALLILPLSYELLNPDPERSRIAFHSLPLVPIIQEYLGKARAQGLARRDFSTERLSRMIANTFFLTALQWATYRRELSIHEELRKALQIMLEGLLLKTPRPVGDGLG